MLKLMLAGKCPPLDQLRLPMWASPKLDGIRAVVHGGVVYSRNGKPIPCPQVQSLFGKLEGLDGELVVGDPTSPSCFRDTGSVVMADAASSDELRFHVFDSMGDPDLPFERRYEHCMTIADGASSRIVLVPQYPCATVEEVMKLEAKWVLEGHEGLMLRDPAATYKNGRSTPREQGLLKLKRFQDAEGLVVGYEELMHNSNDKDASGKRTSHKAGMQPLGKLGALVLVNDKGERFNVGTGFTDGERKRLWKIRTKLYNKKVRYRYFPTGAKSAPRFPVFDGFREDI